MKKICIYTCIFFAAPITHAMEEAQEIFKKMTRIGFDGTKHLTYRAYAENQTLRAVHLDNTFTIAIETKDSMTNVLDGLFQDNEPEQIFNFLAYLFNQKTQKKLGAQDKWLIEGTYPIEGQEMPENFKWNPMNALREIDEIAE